MAAALHHQRKLLDTPSRIVDCTSVGVGVGVEPIPYRLIPRAGMSPTTQSMTRANFMGCL